MRRHPSDAVVFCYVVAILVGFMLAFIAAGCSTARVSGPALTGTPATPELRGPIVIRVRIVDTDPSDDVSLSFAFICARAIEVMRGEGVQS